MINIGKATTKVHVEVGATDLRKGFEGLQGEIRNRKGMDPSSGHLFVFSNRGKSRIKILYFDGSGMWVSSKRLEKGRFDWPEAIEAEAKILMNLTELLALVDGLQLHQTRAKAWWRKKVSEAA